MKVKNYLKYEVLEGTVLELKYEFFTSKKGEFIIEDLKNKLQKSISSYPNRSSFSLTKAFNSDNPKYVLISEANWNTSMDELDKILNWINENCSTKYSTSLSVKLKFDKFDTPYSISTIPLNSIIKSIDESIIYSKLNNQLSPMILSINPFKENNLNSDLLKESNIYRICAKDKGLGILEFNWIGGENYHKNISGIKEVLEYLTITTFNSINSNDHLSEYSNWNYNIGLVSPSQFLEKNPKLKLTVNLNSNIEIIKTYWSQIKENLYTIYKNKELEGSINLDTEKSRFQLKGLKLNETILRNYDILNCEIKNCLIDSCDLYNLKCNESHIYNSNLMRSCEITQSYIQNTMIFKSNTLNKSIIKGFGHTINSELKECEIFNMSLGTYASTDDKTILIQDELKTKPINGSLKR